MDQFSYTYAKERRKFGRQCLFSERHQILAHIPNQPELLRNYILEDPVTRYVQKATQMAADDVLTINPSYKSRGINHVEGGWPKDVNYLDEEQTVRHKKKIERDDQYAIQLSAQLKPMCHAITQNTAVQLYECYFEPMDIVNPYEISTARMIKCYRDPWEQGRRPASHITYSPDNTQLSVAYGDLRNTGKNVQDVNSYVWDMGNTQTPILKLTPDAQCTKLEYSRDGRFIAGGLLNGKICIWDPRAGSTPQMSTLKEICHSEPVTSVLWIHSKSNTECYSGSTDGMIYWWDIRSLDKPTEKLICDPVKTDDQQLSRCFGVTVLEYEFTIPTRFLVGTDEGYVFFGNRKGMTPSEKLLNKVKCTNGPIYALERNPMYSKCLLVVGDHAINIWNEDCKDNSIIWSKHFDSAVTCGTWSRQRSTMFFIGKTDGTFEAWDLLIDMLNPIIRLKISNFPMHHIRANEHGEWVSCSDGNGEVCMIELSENLATQKRNDRALLSAMIDREVRREKILEGKIRELKLKEKQTIEAAEAVEAVAVETQDDEAVDDGEDDEIKPESKEYEGSVPLELIEMDIKEFMETIMDENNRRVKGWQKLNKIEVETPITVKEEPPENVEENNEKLVETAEDTKTNENEVKQEEVEKPKPAN